MLGSALAKNDDVGVKQIELVGVKGGAVGLSVICFRGVLGFGAVRADVYDGGGGSGVSVGGGVELGGVAMCLCVRRFRLICLSLAIFCWCVVAFVGGGEVGRGGVGGVGCGVFCNDGSVGVGGVVAVDGGGDGVGSMYVGRPGNQLFDLLCGVHGVDFVGVGVGV